jgi:hypothetical protein
LDIWQQATSAKASILLPNRATINDTHLISTKEQPMKYGKMTVEQNTMPVEVGILVEDGQPSGPFIANRERRGIAISDNVHQLNLTADEALMLLVVCQC